MNDLGEKMRKRSSRRATTYGVAALVSLSLIAAACGGSDDDADDTPTGTEATDGTEADTPDGTDATDGTEAPDDSVLEDLEIEEDVVTVPEDETPVPGGTLSYGLEADVDGLNPTSSALSAPGLMMANAVFDTLTAFDTEGVAVPYLAESVEPVDGDLAKWIVTIRQGITFHDGTPVTIDAVLLGFETQKADPLVGLAVKPFYPETGATERIDDYSAQFNLLEPNAAFPGALTGQLGYVSSPTWLAAALADPTLNQQPVGSGPFVFDSRSPDSVTRFVRNEDWWNGDVYLDAVEFVPVPDADTRAELLLAGDLNALQTSDPGAILALDEDPSIQQVKDETGEESFVMVNTGMAPFDDIRAREALTLATPVENYLNLIGLGTLRPASQRFIPESPYYNPDVTQESDNPAAAKELSDAYCADFPENCSDGKINMELQFPAGSVVLEQTGDLMIQGWGESFNVEIQTIPQDEHIQEAALGQFNAVLWRQFGAEDPALDNVWLMCRTVGGISLNWPKSCDPARDELLLQAQASTDPAERAELYKQISVQLHDQYLYIFLSHTTWSNAFAEDVRGVCDRLSPEGVLLRCVSNGRNWFSSIWIAQ
jgi:peptide/nickel transport system substrate-binding protein